MNQQLLNINTVLTAEINKINTVNTVNKDDLNNTLRLKQITSIVNNNTRQEDNNKEKYKIIRFLGRGIQGNLYLAIDRNGNRVICKEIQLDTEPKNNAIQTQQLEFELNILKYLSNNKITREHVNPCLEYKIHHNYIYTIFPVFKGYSLEYFHKYMLKLSSKNDYYTITFFLIKSLLHALAKIHDTNIAHQNIGLNNILVSTFIEPDEIKIKFTDFGLGCGCPKVFTEHSESQIQHMNKTIIQWKDNELFKKIGNCKQNGHVPVKYIKKVLELLKDTDYLKISQKYDILCIGLIIIKLLLFFDTEIIAIIENLFLTNMNNNTLKILYNKITKKYFSLSLENDNKNNDKHNTLLDMLLISNTEKEKIIEYLKLILQYMITAIIKRRTAQYVLDKIIIYEKYKNDIF